MIQNKSIEYGITSDQQAEHGVLQPNCSFSILDSYIDSTIDIYSGVSDNNTS